ncbi:hypothetical protein JYT55_01265 [Mariprofundus ferrooxydans]|nr:hypothetical protein [Mariprofundus ferrooxydans]
MIHHYSIPVSETKKVASILAKLFKGMVTGFGPYKDSYIVWMGDDFGTAIELYPCGTEMIPDTGNGQSNFVHNPSNTGFTATHAAISIERTREEIYEIAKEHGWRALELPRGGFNVIEFWIENKVMIELLTPDMANNYLMSSPKFKS